MATSLLSHWALVGSACSAVPRNAGFPDGRFLLAAPLANEGRPRVVGDAHRWGRGLQPLRPGHVTRLQSNPALAPASVSGFGRLKNPRERRCLGAVLGPCPNLAYSHSLCGKQWARFSLTISTLHLGNSHTTCALSLSPLDEAAAGTRAQELGQLELHFTPAPEPCRSAGRVQSLPCGTLVPGNLADCCCVT